MDEVKIGTTIIEQVGEELYKKGTSIIGRSKKLADETHAYLISAMWHAQQHGDTGFITRLVGGLHGSQRKQGIVAWLNEFMPVTDDGVNAKNGEMKLLKDRTADDFRIGPAEETPYWDFTVEKAPTPANWEALLAAVNRMAKKGMEQGTMDEVSIKRITDTIGDVISHAKEAEEAALLEGVEEVAPTGTES
jgi:hypothetical protein